MTYVHVPVPEEHVPAVLEFVLSRVRVAAPVEATPDASVDPGADDEDDAELASLMAAVTDAARDMLHQVARMPDIWMNFMNLTDVAQVPNVGAALQSLQIQCSKLGIASPITKRRDSREEGRFVYWMSADSAARILRIEERNRLKALSWKPALTTEETT